MVAGLCLAGGHSKVVVPICRRGAVNGSTLTDL